jgi:tRNA nucleotidyltransferase/poly(A) polymerase
MRAVRIASELNFKIEKNTLSSIKENASLINRISYERIRDELFKILKSPHPYQGMVIFRETGLMQKVLPEMEKTFEVEQKSPGRHHIYDVGTHSMRSLKFVAKKNPDHIVRLATLIHDVGKPITFKRLKNGTITFYNHEIVSARIAKNIADRLRFSNKDREKLYKLVRYHQFSVDERQTDSALRRFLRKVGLENVQDMLDLRVGDRLGGGASETSWRLEEFKKRLIEVQRQPFTVHDLKITGHDVMKKLNIKPGPEVGKLLDMLFKEVVEKKIPNEKEILLQRVERIKK